MTALLAVLFLVGLGLTGVGLYVLRAWRRRCPLCLTEPVNDPWHVCTKCKEGQR